MARVFVEQSACDGCGACVAVCSFDAISVEHGHAIVDAAECTGCSACLGECPAGAISQEEEMFVRPGWERPAHGFWVLAETVDGSVTGATLELLTIARRLCDDPVNDVCAVLVGEENASLAELLGVRRG
ncbi:MAG: 4Fe-4S binding protein [Thermoleophilia bacterium]|nr:4Fe-4S binding protein [Thermoleophilia bacterium]